MPADPEIERVSQRLEPGELIALYTLDLTPLGTNQTWTFTPTGPATFRGIDYVAADVETSGWEMTGQGQMPQPILRLANVSRWMSGIALAYDDLIGARLTRLRTYTRYLDDGISPDPDAAFPPDIYVIEQKRTHTKLEIEWSLSAAMDQDGRMLPGRTIWRDLCGWRYRTWNPSLAGGAGAFDYTKVTCPWTGRGGADGAGPYFRADGTSTVQPSQDSCSKQLGNGCKLRFGANAVLPFGGFPGVARVRT